MKFSIYAINYKNYAIDYNNNSNIELKKIEDFFASAVNYINKIGWKTNSPCFLKIDLKEGVPKKFCTSARSLKNKKVKTKKFLKRPDIYSSYDNMTAAIITPDKDIIPGSSTLKPAYLVLQYELI